MGYFFVQNPFPCPLRHGELNCFQAFFDFIQYIQLAFTANQRVNTCSVNAGMSEQVCQPDNILFRPVIIDSKKMPEIMREDLTAVNMCIRAQRFHSVKYVAAVERTSGPGDKDAA